MGRDGERPYELIVAKWPEPEAQVDPQAEAEIDWLIAFIAKSGECEPSSTYRGARRWSRSSIGGPRSISA